MPYRPTAVETEPSLAGLSHKNVLLKQFLENRIDVLRRRRRDEIIDKERERERERERENMNGF